MQPYIVKDIIHFCNVSLKRSSGFSEKKIWYYDLTFVLSGSLTYKIDGVSYTLCKNDCIFLKPDTLRGRNPEEAPVKFVSFNFSIHSDAEVPKFETVMRNCISQDIKSILSVFSQNHISENFHSKEKCINILNYILFELIDKQTFKSQNPHIRKILKYIDEHINDPISLKSVSSFIGLSPEYTSALFRSEMGKTLTDYINCQKLLFAKKLILESEMPLCDIALYLGFENYNYFSRLFKKHFKVSPKNIQKRRGEK